MFFNSQKDRSYHMADYDLAVFVARAQPFHMGHLKVIDFALERANHLAILIGSANSPRCHRNPFTYDERVSMIIASLPGHFKDRVHFQPLDDSTYNDKRWIQNVQAAVERTAWIVGYTTMPPRIALIGHSKDSTSFYLKLFPQWSSINVPNYHNLNSTTMRNAYFSNIGHMWLQDADGLRVGDLENDRLVPTPVKQFLVEFINTSDYKLIRDEYEFVLKYKQSWASAPYPVNLVCVDACVIKAGHVLLITRGALPGKGLLALPGGYLNVTERAVNGMIRELREETRLKVPEAVLRGSIATHEVFDDPNRSARGRVITIGYLIDLGVGPLDKVKGGDDAASAKWVPLKDLNPKKMFEDHFFIIEYLLGL
jgi:bifunctional NMN adenylyltransferase/nudix hydrolase